MPFIGFGCDLAFNAVSVGSVMEISHPDVKVTDVKTSYIQMAQPWHTFQAGLADGGDASFKLLYIKTAYNTVLGNIRVSGTWTLTFSDIVSTASVLTFTGYINKVSAPIALDDL